MQAVAKVKNVRYGVRKLRQVVDLMRGKSVAEAFAMLSILRTQKKGAVIVENALKSAVANFKQKSPAAVTAEELKITAIFADGAMIMKRIRPRSQGRAYRIEKPMSLTTPIRSKPWVKKLIRTVFALVLSEDGSPNGTLKASLPNCLMKISLFVAI